MHDDGQPPGKCDPGFRMVDRLAIANAQNEHRALSRKKMLLRRMY